MEKYYRFRRETLAVTLGLLGGIGLLLWMQNPLWAQGFVMGGAAGVLGFLLLARSVGRMPDTPPEKLGLVMMRDMVTRVALYGLMLWGVWRMSDGSREAMFCAMAGIMVPRVAMYGVALVRLRGG